MLLFVPKDRAQKRKKRVKLWRRSLRVIAFVGPLDDLFDHAEHERTRLEVDVELLEKLEDVATWLLMFGQDMSATKPFVMKESQVSITTYLGKSFRTWNWEAVETLVDLQQQRLERLGRLRSGTHIIVRWFNTNNTWGGKTFAPHLDVQRTVRAEDDLVVHQGPDKLIHFLNASSNVRGCQGVRGSLTRNRFLGDSARD
jgi:hypothetical protein